MIGCAMYPTRKARLTYVEVQFKNTRKGYYLNSAKIPLEKGDIVAVEASPGHDIGTVSLTGKIGSAANEEEQRAHGS